MYLDDIVIYNKTLAEHVEHLWQVLVRLREHELYAKVSKRSFSQVTISFLGHIVERGHIRMDPKKVQAIEEWQPPSDVHDLCSFLGLHYLLGSPFVVKTDNAAVSHFITLLKLTSRQARWQELLAEFYFVLEYRASSSNHVADALSRKAVIASLRTRQTIRRRLVCCNHFPSQRDPGRASPWTTFLDCLRNGSRTLTLDSPQAVRSPLTRSYLEKVEKRMKKYADQNRRFIEFNARDLVMMKVPDPRLSKSSRERDPRLMQ
ncbi:UNVERIFIED_CONTAM: hypothetical protein Slati_0457200, partial [Sesamum latifolium]